MNLVTKQVYSCLCGLLLPMLICAQIHVFDDYIFEDGDFFLGMGGEFGNTGNSVTPVLTITPTTTDMPATETPAIGQCGLQVQENEVVTNSCGGTTFDVGTNNVDVGCSVTYDCKEGFFLTGTSVRTCTDSGWSSTRPTCSTIMCSVPVIEYGTFDGGNFEYGTTGTATCNEGYETVWPNGNGEEVITCDETGWTNLPTCNFVTCGAVTLDADRVNVSSIVYTSAGGCQTVGCNATYSCKDGYTPTATQTITCEEHSGWSTGTLCIQDTTEQILTGSGGFSNYQGLYDEAYENEVEQKLLAQLQAEFGNDIKAITVTSVNPENGDFTYEVVADKDTSLNSVDLTIALSALVEGRGIDLFGQNVTMNKASLAGVEVSLEQDVITCDTTETYTEEPPCTENQRCFVTDGRIDCVELVNIENTDNDQVVLIAALAGGIPLLAVVFIGMVAFWYFFVPTKAVVEEASDTSVQQLYTSMIPRFTMATKVDTKEPGEFYTFYDDEADAGMGPEDPI